MPELPMIGPVAVVLGLIEIMAFLTLLQRMLMWKRLALELRAQLIEMDCARHPE